MLGRRNGAEVEEESGGVAVRESVAWGSAPARRHAGARWAVGLPAIPGFPALGSDAVGWVVTGHWSVHGLTRDPGRAIPVARCRTALVVEGPVCAGPLAGALAACHGGRQAGRRGAAFPHLRVHLLQFSWAKFVRKRLLCRAVGTAGMLQCPGQGKNRRHGSVHCNRTLFPCTVAGCTVLVL